MKCTKILLIGGILSIFATFSNGQKYDQLESIKSQGSIPDDFNTLSSEKFKSQSQKEIKTDDKKKVAKSKENFLLKSNFILDELLTSGDVLFNDSLSVYVNKVADEILKNNPKLRNEINFYVVKSPHVNAFSTAQGYVLVNIGLLAQIENESQLAYILCHEIIHYTKKHAISQNVKYDTEIKKSKSTSYDKMLASSAYSKELESEADIEGLKLYMDTKYSKDVFDNVFNVLKYSYLPYDEIPYNYEYLETSYFKIGNECKLDTVNSIMVSQENDDELSTHPGVDKRIIDLKSKLNTYTITDKGSEFILGEAYFNQISNIARHELSELFLINKNYGASLYNSFLLLDENPNDLYAKVQTMNALYFLTKYANRDKLYKVVKSGNDVQGESHRVYHMLEKLTSKELNILALNYAFKLKEDLKSDLVIEKVCEDLIIELIEENEMHSSDFDYVSSAKIQEAREKEIALENNKKNNSQEEVTVEKVAVKKSKYDKIKEIEVKQEQIAIDSSNSIRNAFSDLCYTNEFEDFFKKVETKYEKDKAYKETLAFKEKQRKIDKQNLKKGYALGIDKIIVVDPEYYKIDERKKNAVEYMDAENAKSNNKALTLEMAKKVGLDLVYLNPTDMKSNQVQSFNDMVLLNRWFNEKSDHNFDYVSIHQRQIDELTKRNGTHVANWMGVVSVREKKKVGASIVYGVLIPYAWPFVVYYIAKRQYKMYYYNISYDLNSGEEILVQYQELKSNDYNYVKKALTYETYFQIKNKRRAKK